MVIRSEELFNALAQAGVSAQQAGRIRSDMDGSCSAKESSSKGLNALIKILLVKYIKSEKS